MREVTMELREIQSFVFLAKTRSLLEVARESGRTPGAVHKHLKTLEAELGVRLYERHGGTLRLTEAGEAVLPHFQEVLERRDSAVNAIADWKQQTGGLVRVGAGPNFSVHMLPRIISKFRHRYPKVEIFIETGNAALLKESLENGSLDLIFEVAFPDAERSDFVPLAWWESHVGIIVWRGGLPSHCSMERLAKEPFILFQKGSRMQNMIDAHFQRIGFRPNVVMRSDSAEAIKAMVKSRLGLAMLFLFNANAEFRAGSLQAVHTDAPPLSARMVLLKRQSSYTPRAVAAFVQVARSTNWTNLHPIPAESAAT
jgi:LysR family transcriptional regulator, transcription activator of glutamate synthase operon